MEKNVTRRNFLQATAAASALVALAGCSGEGNASANDASGVPAADAYPIDAEEWGSGTPKHAEEEMRDGWTRVTNEGGATLGVARLGCIGLVEVALGGNAAHVVHG